MDQAALSLSVDKSGTGWRNVAAEYRKELKRQSEKARLNPPSRKWWESTHPDFHYNYHKNKFYLEQENVSKLLTPEKINGELRHIFKTF